MAALAPIGIGSIIAKKYAIERVLGEGGMGIVVAAQHTQLRQRVAIKFLLPAVVAHPESVARFVREARASVRIQSEHVARVLDVGELEDGAPYIVMEYLEGADLGCVLESVPRPSAETLIEYVLQACEAVAEAHSLGIVHRDLKPANMFVTRRPDGSPLVKVLDFGISKSSDPSDHALTKTTAFIGSPLYASPEQLLSSRSVDARTDIWALGIILYEACAGQPPFRGENVMEVAARVMQLPPQPLESVRPDLPAGLSAAIMRCLEKDIARRFATVGELARALGPYVPRASVSVDRISRILPASDPPAALGIAQTLADARSQAPPPLAPASTQAEWDQRVSPGVTGRPPRSRVGIVALGMGALLVITTAGVAIVSSRRPAVAAATSDMPSSPASVPAPAVSTSASTASPTPLSAPEPSAEPDHDSSKAPAASASAVASEVRPTVAHPTKVQVPTLKPSASATAPPAPVPVPVPAPPSPAPKNPLDIKIR